MPDHPPERAERLDDPMERPAPRRAHEGARAARRACPRCGSALGALGADGSVESLYCGCCGLVVPAA